MLANAVAENMTLIIWAVIILVFFSMTLFSIMHMVKSRWIIDVDKNYKEYDKETGKLVKEGNPRNIWDYNTFSGVSRLFFKEGEWQTALALLLFFILVVVYLWMRDSAVLNLVGANLGFIIGMTIKRK